MGDKSDKGNKKKEQNRRIVAEMIKFLNMISFGIEANGKNGQKKIQSRKERKRINQIINIVYLIPKILHQLLHNYKAGMILFFFMI